MSRLRSLIFPLALALLLGGLTAWLGRISEVVVEEVKLRPDEPQYLMQHMQGQRFDLSGSLKEQLTATKAWQLPDQKNVYLAEPDLQMFNQGIKQYGVNSSSARYQIADKTVHFENEVLLTKAADAERPAAEVRTARLVVDTEKQTAQTDAAVDFVYGQSQGSANGMTYDHKTGQLNLPERVKALIYDPKQTD